MPSASRAYKELQAKAKYTPVRPGCQHSSKRVAVRRIKEAKMNKVAGCNKD